ncbi:type IV secretory system conjugative DNA transfer family protein [Actinomadura sp. 21ATH]|uniref:type IV secretory system conjugative DNA transfer family protein n=1 Tax=Actinomadura sp. 21ATH TaxID=1735444 RepID=UPI0035C1FA67
MNLPLLTLTVAGQWADLIEELVDDPARFTTRAPWYGLLLVGTALAGATVISAARSLVWRWRSGRLADGARLIEIAVPSKVEESSAAAWWSHLAGLTSPWWKRALYGQPHLAWEFVADADGLRVQVWVPGTVPAGLVEKTVRSAWPGATLTTKEPGPPIPYGVASAGGRLVVGRPEHFPLATEHKADPLRALLGAAAGLQRGEHLAVQVLARPVAGRRLWRAHRAASALRGGRSAAPQGAAFDVLTPGGSGSRQPGELFRAHPERAEQVRTILAKAAQQRYEVQILYGTATTRLRGEAAQRWLRAHSHEVASTFALFTSGNQYLRRKRIREASTRLAARRLGRGYLLSVAELAAIAHLPYDASAPGVTRAGASPVAPSPAVPSCGSSGAPVRILGDAEAGAPRPVALTVAGGRQHLHVLGQTGVGKSTFLANLILSDAHAGRGALVIDPKGDLVGEVLERLPERAVGRTVVFDPMQAGPPPCVNVLAGPDPAFAAESIVTTFRRCFSSAWGPRLDDLMRSACLTLTRVHGHRATLAQVPPLLSDTGFRREVTGKLKDELLSGFWASYDELSPAGRAAVIGPVMNKLRAVLLRPFVRDALSGSASTVDLRRVLDGGGLVLARVPKGILGEDAARLLGSLLLAHTWQAMTPRARQAENTRRDVAAYVDEAHNFLNLPGSVSDILAEARAYRFSLVLAHQHLSQLPKDLREAVSADARNKVYFAVSPEDAAALTHQVSPLVTPYDLSHLGAYQAAGRVVTDGATSAAFTFRTRPLPEAIPDRAEAVRAASIERFGARPDRLMPTALPRTFISRIEEE